MLSRLSQQLHAVACIYPSNNHVSLMCAQYVCGGPLLLSARTANTNSTGSLSRRIRSFSSQSSCMLAKAAPQGTQMFTFCIPIVRQHAHQQGPTATCHIQGSAFHHCAHQFGANEHLRTAVRDPRSAWTQRPRPRAQPAATYPQQPPERPLPAAHARETIPARAPPSASRRRTAAHPVRSLTHVNRGSGFITVGTRGHILVCGAHAFHGFVLHTLKSCTQWVASPGQRMVQTNVPSRTSGGQRRCSRPCGPMQAISSSSSAASGWNT